MLRGRYECKRSVFASYRASGVALDLRWGLSTTQWKELSVDAIGNFQNAKDWREPRRLRYNIGLAIAGSWPLFVTLALLTEAFPPMRRLLRKLRYSRQRSKGLAIYT
jgi:hypothetical protein